MEPADRLLARAAGLLGWQGKANTSEVLNSELLGALAAGEIHGVLVVAGRMETAPLPQAAVAPETPEAPAPDSQPLSMQATGSLAAVGKPSSAQSQLAATEPSQVATADPMPASTEASQIARQAASSAEASTHTQQSGASAEASQLTQPPGQVSEPPLAAAVGHHAGAVAHVLTVHTPASLPLRLAGCPAVYLSRSSCSTGALQTEEELGTAVVANLLPAGPSLSGLQQLLQLVVAPWLAAHQSGAQSRGSTVQVLPSNPDLDAAGSGGSMSKGSSLADANSSSKLLDAAGRSSKLITAASSSSSKLASDSSSGGTSVSGSAPNNASGTAATAASLAVPAAAELLTVTQRFASQVTAAAKHLRSEVTVQLPEGVDLSDVGAAAANEEAVLACERCMEEWVLLATSALQREAAARPQGRGPLPELEFWQARAEAYGGLLEQLSVPAVRAVVAVVERGSSDAALAASLRAQLSELGRLGLDARDNARFLATLERHFRAVHHGSLAAVADAVQPMLNALRMIWVISRHYGDDVHMSNLLERISQGVQDRLDAALDIGTLFRAPVGEALALVRTCISVARGWQAHYLAQRDKIEASGHHARWEFNKSLLFEKTNHVAEVCTELEGMLAAVDDFRQFLGPELKAVTGNTSVIEEVSVMVSAMVEPVEGVTFSPFERKNAADWRAVRQRFERDADDIKLATRDLIDTCFRKLRSVDAAAQLLHSFQRIQTQGAMQQQMEDKLAAVLEHFINEIGAVRRLFDEGKESPPLARNMPPVAGAIRWSRGLLVRLRRTWLRLQRLNGDLEGFEQGKRAALHMTELAKEMLRFEKARFSGWCATVDAAVTAGLQQPVLVLKAADSKDSGVICAPGGGGSARVAINFPAALLRLMREAKYLDQLGFAVPQLAVHLALQEGQIREHFQELGAMLERHAAACASLRSAERSLLAEQLSELEAALEPGLARLNWTSLTIPEFVAAVNKAVDQFNALVAQVQKSTSLIEKTLYYISRARLMPPDTPPSSGGTASSAGASGAANPSRPSTAMVKSSRLATAAVPLPQGQAEAAPGSDVAAAAAAAAAMAGGCQPGAPSTASAEPEPAASSPLSSSDPDVPDLQEFYEDFEQHRQQVVEGLVARYRSVGPLLIKVEELVAGGATGKSPRLAGYYAYWERRLFAAVCGMVVSGLQAFHDRLHACRPLGGAVPEGEDAEAAARAFKPPLFRVALSLLSPEVVVVPSAPEVGRQLGRLLRNIVESAKPFVRWMDGTCLEAPEQYVYGEDAEPFVFSFFSDVCQSPAVIRAMLAAQHEVQRALAGVGKVAERWRAFGGLWKSDRAVALAKLRTRKINPAAGEEKLSQYHRVGEDAWAAGIDQDIHFIRVRCAPLASAVRTEAQAWVRGIAGVLSEAEDAELEALKQKASALLATVQLQPEEEEDVARIKATIASAQASAAAALSTCDKLAERRRARWAYVVPTDDIGMQAELAAVSEVQAAWEQLLAAAIARGKEDIRLPRLASLASLGSEATAAAGEESVMSRKRGSALAGISRMLRSNSNASTASSASSKARASKVAAKQRSGSRQAPAGQAQ